MLCKIVISLSCVFSFVLVYEMLISSEKLALLYFAKCMFFCCHGLRFSTCLRIYGTVLAKLMERKCVGGQCSKERRVSEVCK